MIDTIKNFLVQHFLFLYMGVNLFYYLLAAYYRVKYFNFLYKRYDKSVEYNKPATIMLATLKLMVLFCIFLIVLLVLIIFTISFGRIKVKEYKVIDYIIITIGYLSIILFMTFPLVLLCSFIALFGNYRSEQLEYPSFK